MTYLIKHPINRYTPKFAIAYNNVDYTVAAGIRTVTLSLNTLTQSAGMGLSLASNQITLEAKKYMVYYKAGLTAPTENRGGNINVFLNGVAVSTSQAVSAITTSSTTGTSPGVVTPQNIACALISAVAGDVISFRYSRTSGDVYADTVGAAMSKAFILEIGEST
jgi:hypothetical protein